MRPCFANTSMAGAALMKHGRAPSTGLIVMAAMQLEKLYFSDTLSEI
jgi:hypothetical protein